MEQSKQSSQIPKIILTKTDMPKLEGAWTVGEVRLMVELLTKWLDSIPLTVDETEKQQQKRYNAPG